MLFQSIFPVLAATDVIISLNEKSSQPFTVSMNALKFHNPHWQFFGVDVWMVKCDAAFLTLTLTDIRNVTIENCTFGNWTFGQVEHVIIKNSSSVSKDFPTSLNFYNSSGLMENITIKDLNFTTGLLIQNNSYIQITKSQFVNNTVSYGLIKVLNSSILEMSNCSLQKNKAIDYAGAINADKSFMYLTNTNFSDNNAIQGGGALHVIEGSLVFLKSCTFFYNQVNKTEDGFGGAILLSNSTANGINVNFTGNKATDGGGLACLLHSKVTGQFMDFSHNFAVFGSAIFEYNSSKFSCKNCSLYANKIVALNNVITGAVVEIYHSTINVSGFKCENHTGYSWSCIFATNNSSVFIYDAKFSMNIGCTISLSNNSHLVAVSSSFLNNTTPFLGAIWSMNSVLDISYCTFSNNSNTTMNLLSNTTASIVNCIYENNSTPYLGGALIVNDSTVNVSQSTFLENDATPGGVAYVNDFLLVILNCSFLRNSASSNKKGFTAREFGRGAGAIIWIQMSVLKIYESQIHNNFAALSGIIYSYESSLLIRDSIFQNNIAALSGSVLEIYKHSSLIIENGSLINNSVLHLGRALYIDTNSTLTISNVHLIENKAIIDAAINAKTFSQITIFNSLFVTNYGSVISINPDASLQMNQCVFFNNSDQAISVTSSGVITIKNTEFSHNTGGAILVTKSTNVFFYHCLFNDNFAFRGGAVQVVNSDVRLIGCNFTRNTATNGGVFWISGKTFVTDYIINNNRANGDGRVGNLQENSHISITTSIFRANSAVQDGGVLWIRNGNMSVWSSSFVKNNANRNGGVICAKYFSHINISKTTFLKNNAGNSAGVIFSKEGSKVFVNDSIIKHNSANVCGMMLIGSLSVVEISFCQIQENNAIILARALCVVNSSFILKSSFFKGKTISFGRSISMISNVDYLTPSIYLISSFAYLENCTLIGNQGITARISTSELRLSKTVFLQNMKQYGVDIDIYTSISKFINRIYTYKCLMKRGNMTLKSDRSKYKQIAIKEHFLQKFPGSILLTEETQFASSEFSVS